MCSKDVQSVWQQILSSDMAVRSGCTRAPFINTVHFLPSSSHSVLPWQEQRCSVSLFLLMQNSFQTFIFLLWVTHFPNVGFNKGFLLYCNTSMERTTKYKTYRSHRSSPKLRRLHHAIFSTIKIEGKMTSLFKKCSNSSLLFYIIMIWIWFCSVTWWCSS